MRIVTYNIRYFGHGLKGLASTAASKVRIAEALLGLSTLPDVVALQEVETRSIRSGLAHRGAHPKETQLEAFMRHLDQAFHARGLVQPYHAVYFPAHTYQLGAVKFYTTGLAMLVNAQTVNVLSHNGHKPHRITHYRSQALRGAKQTRIAAHLALEDKHLKKFHLFNTHLSLPTWWARDFWQQRSKMGWGKNQMEEAKTVAEYAQATAKRDPYLVVGDFNSSPGSPVYRYLRHDAKLFGAQEALKQIGPDDAEAFPTAGFLNLRMHLDHVFGSHRVEYADLEETSPFGDERGRFHGLSDHVPLVVRFDTH